MPISPAPAEPGTQLGGIEIEIQAPVEEDLLLTDGGEKTVTKIHPVPTQVSSPHAGFIARMSIPRGVTVWVDADNVVHQGHPLPTDEPIAVFLGGYVHRVSPEIANALAEQGFEMHPMSGIIVG